MTITRLSNQSASQIHGGNGTNIGGDDDDSGKSALILKLCKKQ